MRSSVVIGLATALATVAEAHTVFTTLFINDVDQGDGTCVRMSRDGSVVASPVNGITSQDMACGHDGGQAVAYTCPAPAGAKLTFEFRQWSDASQPGSIAPSHKGPCSVYLKKVDDMATSSAAGGDWFKIWDDGLDTATGQYCVDRLVANDGLLSVNLPTGLPTGYYLVRTEILALHLAISGQPQFYVGCAQLFVSGAADAAPLNIPAANQAFIPGYVQYGDKSVTYNIYDNPLPPLVIPGPAPYIPTASSQSSVQQIPANQTKGAIPSNCLVVNGNWCGVEVPAYSDENGCWASTTKCYDQENACWAAAQPSGGANCRVWEAKCKQIESACRSGNFYGPPNMGQKLSTSFVPIPGGKLPSASSAADAVIGLVNRSGNAASSPPPAVAAVPSYLSGSTLSATARATAPLTSISSSSSPTPNVVQYATETNISTLSVTPTLASATVAGGQTGSAEPEHASSVINPISSASSSLAISRDGKCGGSAGSTTCEGSKFGSCCSKAGQCGSSKYHCGQGCQAIYGLCYSQ